VSAFANAAGGTLTYGIHESKRDHAACKLEGFDPANPAKETLASWIRGNIRPK
jgi:predicted HTH transcriptional regulator